MENAFGGDSDISLAQSEHDRLTGAAEAPAPQDEQVQDSDDVEEFGIFMGDDNQDGNDPFDDPFGLATAGAARSPRPSLHAKVGWTLMISFLLPSPKTTPPRPSPRPYQRLQRGAGTARGTRANAGEQAAVELAALGVPIDEAAATRSPVSWQLLRIVRAAAERRSAGGWSAARPGSPGTRNRRLARRCRAAPAPLTTGATARAFPRAQLWGTASKKLHRQRALGRVRYQGQDASEDDLAAQQASELEAFVAR